jgi:hypothetical protein
MGAGKIFFAESAGFQKRNRESIAKRQRCRRAGGWREPERAGFLGDIGVEMNIGFGGQRRTRIAGDSDQPGALALDQRDDHHQFGASPGIRQAITRRPQSCRVCRCFCGCTKNAVPVLASVMRFCGQCGRRDRFGSLPRQPKRFRCTYEMSTIARQLCHCARLIRAPPASDRLSRAIFPALS